MPKAKSSAIKRKPSKSNLFSSIIKKYENLDDNYKDSVITADGCKIFNGSHKQTNNLSNLNKEKLKKIYDDLNGLEMKSPSIQKKVQKDREQYRKSILNVSFSLADSENEESVNSNIQENVKLRKQNREIGQRENESSSSASLVDSLLDSVLDATFSF